LSEARLTIIFIIRLFIANYIRFYFKNKRKNPMMASIKELTRSQQKLIRYLQRKDLGNRSSIYVVVCLGMKLDKTEEAGE
jgi:hypothetical protein